MGLGDLVRLFGGICGIWFEASLVVLFKEASAYSAFCLFISVLLWLICFCLETGVHSVLVGWLFGGDVCFVLLFSSVWLKNCCVA